MLIKIKEIIDLNNDNERVVLHVTDDVNIGNYIFARTTKLENGISSKIDKVKWFPDKKLSKDDWIVVYSKKGDNKIKVNDDESKTFFIYLGLNDNVWDEVHRPILIEIADWRYLR